MLLLCNLHISWEFGKIITVKCWISGEVKIIIGLPYGKCPEVIKKVWMTLLALMDVVFYYSLIVFEQRKVIFVLILNWNFRNSENVEWFEFITYKSILLSLKYDFPWFGWISNCLVQKTFWLRIRNFFLTKS